MNKKETPAVLVVITSKNRKQILPKAIGAALEQSYSNKQVAVFDDASTDGTQELETAYPQVQWHLSAEPKGYLYARNLFLENTSAGFIASLDDDSWFLDKDALQTAVDYFIAHPDVAAIALDILSPDQPVKVNNGIMPQEANTFIGCGHLLRVSVINSIGNYTPNPGYYGGEEKDLCIRIIDAGYRIVKLNGLYVWHDKTTVARDVARQHRSGVCNDLVFMWRRTPGLLLLPALAAKLFKHFLFSLRYKKAPLVRPCLKGFADFFRFLFSSRVQRRPVSLPAFKKYMRFN
ncbi:MAG: glycosyltransferase [Chitinophagaceae bacterium]